MCVYACVCVCVYVCVCVCVFAGLTKTRKRVVDRQARRLREFLLSERQKHQLIIQKTIEARRRKKLLEEIAIKKQAIALAAQKAREEQDKKDANAKARAEAEQRVKQETRPSVDTSVQKEPDPPHEQKQRAKVGVVLCVLLFHLCSK